MKSTPTAHCPLSTATLPACCWPAARVPTPARSESPAERPLEGVKLRLAVVDDPALAAAVGRVRGEWNAQTGASLEVIEATETGLDAGRCPAGRRRALPVAPAGHVGRAEAAGPRAAGDPPQRPMGRHLRAAQTPRGRLGPARSWPSPSARRSSAATIGRTCWRNSAAGPRRPGPSTRTWPSCLAADGTAPRAGRGSEDSPRPLGEGQGVRAAWCGTIEPLAPGWAGLTLLARAAPYRQAPRQLLRPVQHRDDGAAGLRPADGPGVGGTRGRGQARPGQPARVRSGGGPGGVLAGRVRHGPLLAHRRARRGEREEKTGEAEIANRQIPAKVDPQIRVGFAELPGSRRVFNLSGHVWDNRSEDDDPRVPLLAVAGRLGVVSAKSAHADAAFQLLLWLSDERMSPQVERRQPGHDPVPPVEPEIAGPMGRKAGARRRRGAVRRRHRGGVPPRAMAGGLASARPGGISRGLGRGGGGRRPRRQIPAGSPPGRRRQVAQDHRPSRPRPPESRPYRHSLGLE